MRESVSGVYAPNHHPAQTFDFKQIVKFPPQSGLIRRPS
jgi:hypothetical protein